MPNNRLILRTVASPYGDTTLNSVLSHEDVDNNFIFLKGLGLQTGTTIGSDIVLTKTDGTTISIPFSGSSSGGTGQTIEILNGDFVSLYSSSALTPNAVYKITDIGDRGVYIHALDTNAISPFGTRIMLCPSQYTVGGPWKGVWCANKKVVVNNLMIWGGLVWKNLTGSIGSADDNANLDSTNWVVVPKNNFTNGEYSEIMFGIYYDIYGGTYTKQWDQYGNVLGYPSSTEWTNNGGNTVGFMNPCDVTDWNCGVIRGNQVFAIFNNNINTGIIKNNNFGSIFNNSGSTITNNSNNGSINNNSGNTNSSITNNKNNGGIYENVNLGAITSNGNIGSIIRNSNIGNGNSPTTIDNNSNSGSIYDNSNRGAISRNSNIGGIYENTNLGKIQYNTIGGEINNNSNTSDISGNQSTGDNLFSASDIKFNSNNGFIRFNRINGYIGGNSTPITNISYNTITGNIDSNSNTGAINYNYNLGNINNNTNIGSILNNKNSGNIASNSSAVTIISYNSNNGVISSNSNTGIILNNKNSGDIISNSNSGLISYNSNAGVISTNSNAGTITLNSNHGMIDHVSGVGNIANSNYQGIISSVVLTQDIDGGSSKVITGTTYTLMSWDHNNIYTNVSGATLTVPNGLLLPHNSVHTCTSSSAVTFTGGATINNASSHTKSNGQYAPTSLYAISSNVYILGGNTAP